MKKTLKSVFFYEGKPYINIYRYMTDLIWKFSDEILQLNEQIKRENDYWDIQIRIGVRRLKRKSAIKKIIGEICLKK